MDDIGPCLPPGWKSKGNDMQADIGPVLPKTVKTQDSDIGPCLPPELTLHASDSELDDTEDPEQNVSIGPTLPPNLRGRAQSTESSDEDSYGPRLPAKHSSKTSKVTDDDDSYGPALPPGLAQSSSSSSSKHDMHDEEDDYGPALPPGLAQSSSSSSSKHDMHDEEDDYGPALPPGYHSEPLVKVKGPSLPPNLPSHEEQDEDEDVIGPLPWMQSSGEADGQSAAEEFEARAMAMKNKLTGKDEEKAPQRESWMMELPGYSKNFGLGPRTFRKRALPAEADRSGWTDTPADKARKEKEKREGKVLAKKSKPTAEEVTVSKRDEHLSKQIENYNQSKRAESLMDMHTKDMKRKMEEESGKPKERRAFDRDVDLQVNRFDEARKKTMMKKAAQLGDRFSHSNEKMFL